MALPPLNPECYDGVVSALAGNGELCTTLSPTGYHVPPALRTDAAHRAQRFVAAGRRRRGAQHPLIDLGSVWRNLTVDGQPPEALGWSQSIDPATGSVASDWEHAGLREVTRSFVSLEHNVFVADTVLEAARAAEVRYSVHYAFGEPEARVTVTEEPGGVAVSWEVDEQLGDVFVGMDARALPCTITPAADGASLEVAMRLEPAEPVVLTTWLHFTDRLHYEFPVRAGDLDEVAARHERAWTEFMDASEVVTGHPPVDDFRLMALYTLRCQATPWSIPASLSHAYWGGGAFHDELYPFFGLLSANHPDLAARMPGFRLTTLPQAQQRARGRGALYPWSSTEQGQERDPNGLWLTERFHLGQFAVCAWNLWLWERDRLQLDDLYPLLRELARYFEMNMLERDGTGALRTRACVDFDESVGCVTNGPFTICAAVAALECAASAAAELGREPERAERWRALALELRANLPVDGADGGETFAIPDGKPLHYSIVGPVFPFGVDVESPRARASAALVHRVLRSTRGWRSGLSEPFEGSSWMWTAGHLAVVHALQGSADLAWDAVLGGPAGAGPMLSPNEHVDRHGVVQVPWFTTGCGAWLYGLHALFVQVDGQGARLLPAVPAALPNVRFRSLRADRGVLVSGRFAEGRLLELAACRPPGPAAPWRFRIPARYAGGAGGWVEAEAPLVGPEPVSLLPLLEERQPDA